MGLREKHAAQTREIILNAAFSLFDAHGYDATTMEEIATAAEIGTTTLYRYYPSKDLLILGPLELNGQMAAELAARPAEEPLDLALGHALRAFLTTPRADDKRFAQIEKAVAGAPGLGARILEAFRHERVLLQQAIATRLGRPPHDLYSRACAHFAASVVELVSEERAATTTPSGDPNEADDVLEMVLASLEVTPPVVPRLP